MGSDLSIDAVKKGTDLETKWEGLLFSGAPQDLDGKAIMASFLSWIEQQACGDYIDVLLFTDSAGRALYEGYLCRGPLNRSAHLPGAAAEFTLAEINETNFLQHLPQLIAESARLPISEFLENRGVPVPPLAFLNDVGLSSRALSFAKEIDVLKQFLYAYRWEIFKVGRKKREELFHRFLDVGISDRTRVGVVDLGWNGGIQQPLNLMLNDMFEQISIYGYSLLLRDDPQRLACRAVMPMHGMISGDTCSNSVIEMVYDKRAAIERSLAECAR